MSDTGNLAAALAKAQGSFATVKRDKTVTVKTKTGGSYSFSYAPLDTILEAVRKPLAENGLVVVQLLDAGDLVTMLLHDSGERLSGSVALPQDTDIQGFGSAITYLRRYALQAMLGIAAEDDDDGNRAAGNETEQAGEFVGGERVELLGRITKTGTLAKGTSAQCKGEWREDPEGWAIGFRFKLADDERDIPQVLISGSIGSALHTASAELLGAKVTLKGHLYGVRPKKGNFFYRLVVGDHPDSDYIETDEYRIPAPPSEPPVDQEERPEAATVPLFEPLDAEERALVGGGLPE